MPGISQELPPPGGGQGARRQRRRQPPSWGQRAADLGLTVCAVTVGLLAAFALIGVSLPPALGWMEAVGCLVAAGTAGAILLQRLPMQNVVGGSVVLLGAITLVMAMSAKTGVPLGRVEYTAALGPRLLGLVPLGLPFLWVALVLMSRETARLVLRPWRRDQFYGYHLVSATSVLLVLALLALDPFAVGARGWWSWPELSGPSWHGAPWGSYVVWLLAGACMITLATPWLLPKRPIPMPLTLHAPGLWLLLVAWFTFGNLRGGLWSAGLFGLLILAGVGAGAWAGWRAGQGTVNSEDGSDADG